MGKHLHRTIGALAGSAVALGMLWSGGAAVGQEGAAPPPAAGAPQQPAVPAPAAGAPQQPAAGGERPAAQKPPQAAKPPSGPGTRVQGVVIEKDVKANAIHLRTPQGKGWVQFPQGAPLFKSVPAQIDEIKERDVITVSGLPTALDARGVELVAPGTPPAGNGQAPPAPANAYVPPPTATASVTGTVVGLKPLTVAVGQNLKVTIATNVRTQVMKRTQIQLGALAVGETVTALGDMQRADIMLARAGWVERPARGTAAAMPGLPAGPEGGARPAAGAAAGVAPGARPDGRQGGGRRNRDRGKRPAGQQPGGKPTGDQPGVPAPEGQQ